MMVKVAIMRANQAKALEQEVNEFIQDKNVVDIKYQSVTHRCNGQDVISDRCMIIYFLEEEK